LFNQLAGLWRYRCLDKFRVIYRLVDQELLVEVLDAGYRQDIYQRLTQNLAKLQPYLLR
jgi:mRNA-degrading endonuclease RelE of RelBE toxin-antitoxin system